jgi:hypothetical protein
LTVTAFDTYGNVATGYLGTIHFWSYDTKASLPPYYTFTAGDAGKHLFWATLRTAGSQANIMAVDAAKGSIAGGQTGITVNPAAAAFLTLTGYPSPTTAGVSHSLTVTALDPYGNVATGYLGTIHFTSSDSKASLPPTYTFSATDAGKHLFWATFNTIGVQTITATDTTTASITGHAGVTVVAGTAVASPQLTTLQATLATGPAGRLLSTVTLPLASSFRSQGLLSLPTSSDSTSPTRRQVKDAPRLLTPRPYLVLDQSFVDWKWSIVG